MEIVSQMGGKQGRAFLGHREAGGSEPGASEGLGEEGHKGRKVLLWAGANHAG